MDRRYLLMAALVASSSCFSGSDSKLESQLTGEIDRAAAQGDGADFSRVATFDWDRLYVIDPYTNAATARKQLGFPWPAVEHTAAYGQDAFAVVVFVKGNRVVHWVDFPRASGDLLSLPKAAIPRARARFDVRSEAGRRVLHLLDSRAPAGGP
jgi:hypothetical protein